jgi:hypothetical protein
MMRAKYGSQAVDPEPCKPSQKPIVAGLTRDVATKRFVFEDRNGKYQPHQPMVGGSNHPRIPNLALPTHEHTIMAGAEQTLMPGYTGYLSKKAEVLVGNTFGAASRNSYVEQQNTR